MFTLKADGRTRFGVHATPAQRACDMGRIDLDAIFELQQAVEDAIVERISPFLTLYGQIGACDIADKEGIPRQHQPRVITAACVGDGQCNVLRAMSRCMDDTQLHHTKVQLIPVFELLMRIFRSGLLMHVDGRPCTPRKLSVAGDVVGMVVGLDHCHNSHAPGSS